MLHNMVGLTFFRGTFTFSVTFTCYVTFFSVVVDRLWFWGFYPSNSVSVIFTSTSTFHISCPNIWLLNKLRASYIFLWRKTVAAAFELEATLLIYCLITSLFGIQKVSLFENHRVTQPTS